MGSIRAALSGNTTGRQLLLNLKGAGDFLVLGQIYKPFPHTDTHTQGGAAFYLGSGAGHTPGDSLFCPSSSQSPVSRLQVPGWGREGGCQTLHPALHGSPREYIAVWSCCRGWQREFGTSSFLFSSLQEGWKCPEKEAVRGCKVLF